MYSEILDDDLLGKSSRMKIEIDLVDRCSASHSDSLKLHVDNGSSRYGTVAS